MKKLTIRRGHSGNITIMAPADKEMVVDQSLLQHGVLSVGEFGQSGIKIATFRDWDEAIFDAEDHGYTIKEENPF